MVAYTKTQGYCNFFLPFFIDIYLLKGWDNNAGVSFCLTLLDLMIPLNSKYLFFVI